MDISFPSERLSRAGIAVVVSTVVLTACFVGVLALVRGEIHGAGERFPIYAVAMGIGFVASLIRAERQFGPDEPGETARDGGGLYDGRAILTTAIGVSSATILIVSLAGEGLVYTLREPTAVLNPQLLPYLVAAGLIATGLGYWGLRHWREFATA
jgi:hypothetical protein